MDVERGLSVEEWISGVTGAGHLAIAPLVLLGMTRELLGVEGSYPDESKLSAVVKRESGRGPFFGTNFTLAREAATLRAVSGVVPAPQVLAVSDDGQMFLMERLRGTAAWTFDDPAEQERTVRHYLDILARLHAADITTLQLPVQRLETPARQILADVDDYEQAYRAFCPERPAIDAALKWVRNNLPGDLARTSLLHGDAGPGNFMHESGAVTGLIDWELSHLGDPMDDLAWLWFRKKVLRQDTDLQEWFSIYAAASGNEVSLEKVRFFRVMVLLRVSVASLLIQVRNPGPIEAMANLVCGMLAMALKEQAGEPVEQSALPSLP